MVGDCIIEAIDHSREITVIKLQILNLLHDVFLLLPDLFLLLQDLVELLADLIDTLLVGTVVVMMMDVVDRAGVARADGSSKDGCGPDGGWKRYHSIRHRSHEKRVGVQEPRLLLDVGGSVACGGAHRCCALWQINEPDDEGAPSHLSSLNDPASSSVTSS